MSKRSVFLPKQDRRHGSDYLLVRIHWQAQRDRHIAREPRRGAQIVASYLGTKATDRIAGVLSLNFDHGLNQLWQTLYTGSSLYLHDVIFPRDLFRLLATDGLRPCQ